MDTELTLKLDKTVLETAKRYAEKNDRNLSKLIENFLKNLTSLDALSQRRASLTESLTSVISEEKTEKWASEDVISLFNTIDYDNNYNYKKLRNKNEDFN
ncbi:MAG: DUF6364 family protein [Planctomycetaceae bacterium]|jgi:hypothetical protein|nr:DUF6364 family protein [Planctomycetaceae bacterium]